MDVISCCDYKNIDERIEEGEGIWDWFIDWGWGKRWWFCCFSCGGGTDTVEREGWW